MIAGMINRPCVTAVVQRAFASIQHIVWSRHFYGLDQRFGARRHISGTFGLTKSIKLSRFFFSLSLFLGSLLLCGGGAHASRCFDRQLTSLGDLSFLPLLFFAPLEFALFSLVLLGLLSTLKLCFGGP